MGKTKWGLGGNEVHSDNVFSVRKIKMSQRVVDYRLNKIIIPDFQRDRDHDKIKSIFKKHKLNKKKGEKSWQ